MNEEWERNTWMKYERGMNKYGIREGWKDEWMKLSLDRIQTPLLVIINSFVGTFLNSVSVVVLWPF